MDNEVLTVWIRKIKQSECILVKRIVVRAKHRLITLHKTGNKTFEVRRRTFDRFRICPRIWVDIKN